MARPLTDESRHKLQSTENFIDAIKTVQVPDDHKLVSFDVKSLFTSIPLQLALDCTETAINNSTLQLPLLTNDLMDLLNLCLTSTYFQYNGKHYKQLHGTAMGSPVSLVVAEIVMQNIEEQSLASYNRTILLCTCKQCCAVGRYTMCYSTAKSCSYWKSETLCCVADQGNQFYRHLSINRQLTSADLPKSLDICGVDGSDGNEFMVMNLYSAFSIGTLKCALQASDLWVRSYIKLAMFSC